MTTPAEVLAKKIVDRLIAEKLLSPEDQSKLLPRILGGKMKPEDWKLPIELAANDGKGAVK